jgi:hypothetical protein
MLTTEDIVREFELFRGNGPGIESWISSKTPKGILERLAQIAETSISLAQLNQLLILSHEAGVSDCFFAYYWKSGKTLHDVHPYDVTKVPDYSSSFENAPAIHSLQHLKWGLHRFYTDALLYFGNIREAYRALRQKDFSELSTFFKKRRFDTERLKSRGQTLPMQLIAKDDR